jgi:gliding motility-associated-like protein
VSDDLTGATNITNTTQVKTSDTSKPTFDCDPAESDCDGKTITSIGVAGTRPGLFVTNVVTPNGDGKNDYFVIRNLSDYPGTKVYIFNRWGGEVYMSNDYQNNWNATGLSEGTYYYRVDLNKAGVVTTYKGWVMIIR